jgi:3-oxoacyl-(acyl-carrier-protein) synthase
VCLDKRRTGSSRVLRYFCLFSALLRITLLAQNEQLYWALLCCLRLLEGVSGIVPIDRFDAKEFPTRFGGQIKNFDDEK